MTGVAELPPKSGVWGSNLHITHSNHANSLPNAESNTRNNATVQASKTVLAVDILESLSDGKVRRSVWIRSLALHLHTDNLDRLVPCGKTTTKGRCQNLLECAELGSLLLVGHLADTVLGQTRQTETRTPVGHLADGDCVDTLVDTLDTLLAVDVHESNECGWWLDAGSSHLRLCDLDGLHASAEAHSGVRLCDTTSNTSRDTSCEVTSTKGASIVLGLRCDEEENGTLGGSFDPSPWDKTLVNCIASRSQLRSIVRSHGAMS